MGSDDRRTAPVAGILLAAGTSSRMGRNKLLLALDGETLLHRAARRAAAAGLEPLLVVLGHEADRAAAELADVHCRTVLNPAYETGISSSLRAGLAAVPEEAGAAVVMLADMPLVTREMVEALVARWRDGDAPLVISEYGGSIPAPPTLYGRSLFGELLTMDDGRCGRQVVRRHREEAAVLAWPEALLDDVDTPDDAARLPGLAAPPTPGAPAAGGG